METVQRHVHVSRKTKTLLFIIIPVIAIFSVALLLWRPWYAPKPYSSLPPDPWAHLQYAHSELQESQKLADSGKRSDLLDPQKTLSSFIATDASGDGSFDLRPQFSNLNITHVQSIQDYGKDPKNGDRLFLVTFSEQENVVVFRLRQLLGTEPTKIWSVLGYLITSSSSSRASYGTTWQESDGPFIKG
jgi:hypothetical protein